jgi:YebC/PmpR family DNA-binding regulatory protein
MAGHSKWANIKHRKARQDAAKGKIWSKCSKAIIVAAKQGGPDPDANLALRYAIDEAKSANVPKDNIERAIKKGAGATEGEDYEAIRYEGYGAGGVAVIVDALTDNRARTAPEVRSTFGKHGGNLGANGCVAFMFEQRGVITIDEKMIEEERLMEIAVEAGADDVEKDDGYWTITTDPADYLDVKAAIDDAGLETESAGVTMIATNTAELDDADAEKVMKLIDALEDLDDVQKVYTNAEFSEAQLAAAD